MPEPARDDSGIDYPPATLATLVDVLDWHAQQHGERLLVTIESHAGRMQPTHLTYARLHSDALAVAAGLVERGCGAGDAVAVMLPTGSEFFAAFYGALYAGCVPVPLYPPARLAQLEDHLQRSAAILRNAEARLLITVNQAKPFAQLLRAHCETLQGITTVADLAVARGQVARPAISAASTAFLQYTSGSTGNPKGVVLSHANLLANVRAMWRASRVSSADTFVSWLPLYHDMGLIGACIGSLVVGYRLVLMSPLEFLAKPSRWLWAIHRHRGTLSAAPNFAYELCANKVADADLEGLDLGSWRLAFNGAEPVSTDTLERFASRFARYGFRREAMFTVFGLAEGVLGVTFPPLERGPLIDCVDRAALMRDGLAKPARAGDANALRVVSCGVPLPGHEVRVVDAAAHELPERAQGRVQFRGPSATHGYYRNPAANAALFAGDWLNTGDLGYFAAGELYLTGREKDLIIRRGVNIHPAELEAAVANLPGVRKGGVAVFAAADRAQRQRAPRRAGRDARHRRRRAPADHRGDHATRGRPHRHAARRRRARAAALGAEDLERQDSPRHSARAVRTGRARRSTQRAPWWQLTRLRGPRRCRAGLARHVGRGACRLGLLGRVGFPDRGGRRLADDDAAARHRAAPARGARVGARRARLVSDSGPRRRARAPARKPAGPSAVLVVANHASYADSILLTAVLPPRFGYAAMRELASAALLGAPLRRLGAVFVERADAAGGVEDTGGSRSACPRRRAAGDFPRGDFPARSRAAAVQARRLRRRGAYRRADHPGRAGRHALAAALRRVAAAPLRDRDHGRRADRLGRTRLGAALALRAAARSAILASVAEPDAEIAPHAAGALAA